jgi:hypothetical protein
MDALAMLRDDELIPIALAADVQAAPAHRIAMVARDCNA